MEAHEMDPEKQTSRKESTVGSVLLVAAIIVVGLAIGAKKKVEEKFPGKSPERSVPQLEDTIEQAAEQIRRFRQEKEHS
jgi:hypothetical protein